MLFDQLLNTEKHLLSDGSMYELMRRHPDARFDAHIAHSGMIYDDSAAAVLEQVLRAYIQVGVDTGFAMAMTTTTWRANPDRIRASAFAGKAVNEDNARFLIGLRDDYSDAGLSLLIGGNLAPRGDAYQPREALTSDQAESFHREQIEALAGAGVDFLQLTTAPALSEAIGIARVMRETGLPFVISFVIDRAGRLLDGCPLEQAMRQIDEATDGEAHYAVNCVHPEVLLQVLQENAGPASRLVAFAGNTSARSADELAGLEHLESEDPGVFAQANRRLLEIHPIPIIGGCCGTSPAHMRAIAGIL